MGASLSHCKKMGAEPGRKFLKWCNFRKSCMQRLRVA